MFKHCLLNLRRFFPGSKIMKYWNASWVWRQRIFGRGEMAHTYVWNWRVYPLNHLDQDCWWNYVRLIYFILLPGFKYYLSQARPQRIFLLQKEGEKQVREHFWHAVKICPNSRQNIFLKLFCGQGCYWRLLVWFLRDFTDCKRCPSHQKRPKPLDTRWTVSTLSSAK